MVSVSPDQTVTGNKSGQLLWPAPGKLNLFLHITGRRDDGYHTLQTIFQFIGLSDQISILTNQDGEIAARHSHQNIALKEDLTLRAARLLQQATGCSQGAEIELIKNLPIGGGVGGGSSDAATVLLGLNHLWQTGLSEEELAATGLQLGADVPVFVHGRACWAEGVGEYFQDVDIPEPVYLLVYPKVHVSTAKIFADQNLTRDTTPIKIADFLAGQAGNDCETVVCRQVPQVEAVMQWLARFSKPRLTGTGACVFAEFNSEQEACEVADQCTNDWQTFVTQGYNRSSLHRMLDTLS